MKFSYSNALIKSSPWCGLVSSNICFLMATSRLVRLFEVDFEFRQKRYTLTGFPAIILVSHLFLSLVMVGGSLSIFPAVLTTFLSGG